MGIYTFPEAIKAGHYSENNLGKHIASHELDADLEVFRARQNPPNLSLNTNIKIEKRRYRLRQSGSSYKVVF